MRALGRGQEAGSAMSALVPPGAGCAGLGRGRYQQGLGEGGSCQTKPSLNRNSSGGPGLGQEPDRPPSVLSGPAAQPPLSRDFSHHILNSEKPPGSRAISPTPCLRVRQDSYHLDKWHPFHRVAHAGTSMLSQILIPHPPHSVIITNHVGCVLRSPLASAHFIIVTSL